MSFNTIEWPVLNREPGRLPWMMQVVNDEAGTLPPGAESVYIFEKNPYQMDSPLASLRTASSGEILGRYTVGPDNSLQPDRAVLRTKADTKTFTFSGRIWTTEQYQRMSDFYGYDAMIALRDHFGRVYIVRFTDFDCQPQVPTPRLAFKWEYKIECMVYDYLGMSGTLWQRAAGAGLSFNGYGEGSWSVENVDATAGVTTWTLAESFDIRTDWETLGNANWESNWAAEVNSWYPANSFDTTRYPIWVLNPPVDLYEALAKPWQSNHTAAKRCIKGIALELYNFHATSDWHDGIIALGVDPSSDIAQDPDSGSWWYAQAYTTFRAAVDNVSVLGDNEVTPMSRLSFNDVSSWDFNGHWSGTEIACMYLHVTAGGDMQAALDAIYLYRQHMFNRGVYAALGVSLGGTPQDTLTGDAYQAMYQAARQELPHHARVMMFWYEDFWAPYPKDANMNTAYAGVANDADTVTDQILGTI